MKNSNMLKSVIVATAIGIVSASCGGDEQDPGAAGHPLEAEAKAAGVELKSSAMTQAECEGGGNPYGRCPMYAAPCNYNDTPRAGETLILHTIDGNPFNLVCRKLVAYPRLGDPGLYPDLGHLGGGTPTPGADNNASWIKQGPNMHTEMAANRNDVGIAYWHPAPAACVLPITAVNSWTRIKGEFVNGTYMAANLCQGQYFSDATDGVTSLYFYRF